MELLSLGPLKICHFRFGGGTGAFGVRKKADDHTPEKNHDRYSKHHGASGDTRELHRLIPPRHTVGGQVPPTVRAGEGEGEQHQGRAQEQQLVAPGLQCEARGGNGC